MYVLRLWRHPTSGRCRVVAGGLSGCPYAAAPAPAPATTAALSASRCAISTRLGAAANWRDSHPSAGTRASDVAGDCSSDTALRGAPRRNWAGEPLKKSPVTGEAVFFWRGTRPGVGSCVFRCVLAFSVSVLRTTQLCVIIAQDPVMLRFASKLQKVIRLLCTTSMYSALCIKSRQICASPVHKSEPLARFSLNPCCRRSLLCADPRNLRFLYGLRPFFEDTYAGRYRARGEGSMMRCTWGTNLLLRSTRMSG